MKDLQFLNNGAFVHEGPARVALLFSDAIVPLGVTESITVREEAGSEGARLENRVDQEFIPIRKISGSRKAFADFMVREFMTPELRTWLVNRGMAPASNEVRYRLCKSAEVIRLFGEEKARAMFKEGLAQSLDSTAFPPPTGHNVADNGAGGIADATYYGWVVHVYANLYSLNPLDKVESADFILANIGNYTRSVHFIAGTPTASDSVAASGGSNALEVTWTDAVIPSGYPRPTHTFVVIGTNNDITHASSHVAAIVEFGTQTATITALGSVDFGAVPVDSDLWLHERVNLSGDQRTYPDYTKDTDYTFNPETTETQRLGAGIADGSDVRRNLWYIMAPSITYDGGAGGGGETYATLAFFNFDSDETDPDTRRATGTALYAWRVNVAEFAGMLLQGIREGFHEGRQMSNVEFLKHPDHSTRWEMVDYDPSFGNFIDHWSKDKLAA